MDIQSAYNSGLQGFLQAQGNANKAAQNIVESTVTNSQDLAIAQQPTDELIGSTNRPEKLPDLSQSIVDLKVAELQAKASAQVIKTADDTLGNILDVSV